MKNFIITALVRNKAGVLNRAAGLFAKRGYNIESLSVSGTEDATKSRMTIVARGDEYVLEQITKQLEKLVDVVHVKHIEAGVSILRELLLVKIHVRPEQRPEIESTARTFKAKSVDLSEFSQTLELTGEGNKIDSFVRVLEPYGIIEMARTGITALERGEENINAVSEE